MKNLITKSVLILALTGASLAMASDSGTTVENTERIIQFSDLNKDEIESFCKANMEGVILSIEGSTISFTISIDSDLLDVSRHTPRKVQVMKSCFIKCEKGLHLFSSDFKDWKSFKDFFHTNMDTSFHIDEKTNLVNINLHIELNQKD